MTTTRELRAVLRDVEPSFKGVEVDAMRARARAIRRRRRITGSIVGCVAAVAAVASVQHLPLHPPRGSAQAAMPGTGPGGSVVTPMASRRPGLFAPRTGALPGVTKPGKRVDVGVGGYQVWLAPSAGATGVYCYSLAGDRSQCHPLARTDNGLAGAVGISGPRKGPTLVMIAETPVQRATASSRGKLVTPAIMDLGQGYVVVVALMPEQPAGSEALDQQVLLYDDTDTLVAGFGLAPEPAPVASSIAEPPPSTLITAPGKRITVGPAGEEIWLAPPVESGGRPRVCQAAAGSAEPSACNEFSDSSGAQVFTLAITDKVGRDVEVIVTDAKVTRVTAFLDGNPVPATIVSVGSGYLALRAVFMVGFDAEHRTELHGFDTVGREVATSLVGTRLSR